MCITDECDKARREFLAGAAGAVVGLAASNNVLAQTGIRESYL